MPEELDEEIEEEDGEPVAEQNRAITNAMLLPEGMVIMAMSVFFDLWDLISPLEPIDPMEIFSFLFFAFWMWQRGASPARRKRNKLAKGKQLKKLKMIKFLKPIAVLLECIPLVGNFFWLSIINYMELRHNP